jgi:hypothetical protein
MRNLITIILISVAVPPLFAQGFNKVVFGPLEGNQAGVLTVRNGDAIEVEIWVRTDPNNPGPVIGITHGLLSQNTIIAERNGANIEPQYDYPNWPSPVGVDGPFVYNPNDAHPIPEGHTCEMQYALPCDPFPCEGDWMDTQGEWDLYGTWLMVTNTGIPIEETYYPFAEGWYPHSGQGTFWAFEYPPYYTIPFQDYCGLYFESDTCIYIPGDVNHNGTPLELADVLAMINSYWGTVEPYYTCTCTENPPFYDFPATADPNGNCVANELSDLVTEIYAYRGTWTVSGCPDCPGSD